MTTRSPFIAVLAALVLTACAMATADRRPADAGDTAAVCTLRAVERAGQVALTAEVGPGAARSGRYTLNISGGNGNSATIVQGGDFALAAGEAAVLGQASLSGRVTDYEADFTLDVGGRRTVCPLVTP